MIKSRFGLMRVPSVKTTPRSPNAAALGANTRRTPPLFIVRTPSSIASQIGANNGFFSYVNAIGRFAFFVFKYSTPSSASTVSYTHLTLPTILHV